MDFNEVRQNMKCVYFAVPNQRLHTILVFSVMWFHSASKILLF